MEPIISPGALRKRSVQCHCFAALHLRQRNLPAIVQRAIGRIRPRHAIQQVAHDLPMRKQLLNLLRIGHLQRTQDQPLGCAFGNHAQIVPTRDLLIRDNRSQEQKTL